MDATGRSLVETIYVVDTHALLWYLAADERLSVRAKRVLDDPASIIVIPAIVIAESLFIIEHGKSKTTSSKIWAVLREYENVIFHPLDLPVLQRTESVTAIPEIHDRQIVATALLLKNEQTDVWLITKDRTIAESNLVPILW